MHFAIAPTKIQLFNCLCKLNVEKFYIKLYFNTKCLQTCGNIVQIMKKKSNETFFMLISLDIYKKMSSFAVRYLIY